MRALDLARRCAALFAIAGCAAAPAAPAPSFDTASANDTAGASDTASASADVPGTADTALDSATTPGDAAAAVFLSLSPTELYAAIPQRDFLLINLVVPTKTLIDGTDLSVAATDTAGLEAALQHDKQRKVVVYCMSGKTSKMVMAKLAGLGYVALRDLDGGLLAWQKAGLPVKKL